VRDIKRKMAFFPISAGTMDHECFICHVRPGRPVALPNGVRLVCDCCSVLQSVMNEQEPERELFCVVCGMETTVVGIDAVVHYENPKDLD
jgi:hypothetical protein